IQRAVRRQEPRLLDALEIGVFSKLASGERKSLRNQTTRRVPSLALELHPIAAFRAQQEVLPEQRDQRDEKDREPGHRAVQMPEPELGTRRAPDRKGRPEILGGAAAVTPDDRHRPVGYARLQG